MSQSSNRDVKRRQLLMMTAGFVATPAILRAQDGGLPLDEEEAPVKRNVSGFRAHTWQPYFDSLRNGAILVDTKSRTLHYWSDDETIVRVYPTSVPLSEELTRRGRTSVTQKVEGPGWAPTPSMKKRNPEWPDYVPPGPDNPLGTHALYLSWKYYRIHGTHDTRKIGRQSSNGCIGLYNEDIAELFELAKVGTQVLLI
ncbi:L,D-transpeptidase [Fluviibacterium sp. DFM31]|uniref:L,D-transpeptidase n=2 Tax=Meridianimarinicoccus marinus TaxID=3231483 RepID=A0ABV3L8R9_9RHOB